MTGADPVRHRALFYVGTVPEVGTTAVVDGDEGFHAAKVRRMRPGEHLDVGDGAGVVAHCVVEEVGNGRLSAQVLDRRTVAPAAPAVIVVQALPKSDRSELAIELATEAGADAFVAWQAARCVAKWESAPRVDKGLRRWRAVTRSAARQSRRAHIPPVAGVESTAALTERVSAQAAAGGVVLVLHESGSAPLSGSVTTSALTQAESVMLVIGPEGGIIDDELETLSVAGAQVVRLGPTVLRTSTAAAVALGALGVLTPRWV